MLSSEVKMVLRQARYALQSNHSWHETTDEDDRYPESHLHGLNVDAIRDINRIMADHENDGNPLPTWCFFVAGMIVMYMVTLLIDTQLWHDIARVLS